MTGVRAAFHEQAGHCASLGSSLTARLCRLCGDRLDGPGDLARRVLDWPGDPTSRADALALRLMGGLHALVLAGKAPDLARAYSDAEALSDDLLWSVLSEAFVLHKDHLLTWLANAPQTNEVRRSAVLIAAGHWLAAHLGRPLVLSEMGASAGLNLLWDNWAMETPYGRMGPKHAPVLLTPEWRGAAPVIAAPRIAARAGVDLNPLDPVADRLRLLSYIWADQSDRLARTAAALDFAARTPPPLARGDAVDWLADRLLQPHQGALHLVFHTVAWQYFPGDAQIRGDALFARHGALATQDAPLARLGMEADRSILPGATVTLDLWPGPRRLSMGRVDFHGRWIDWCAPPP